MGKNKQSRSSQEGVYRVKSKTGGEKETKRARFDLIPVDSLWEMAEHYGKGAEKYNPRNWEAGYDWSLSYAALQRHAHQFWGGEMVDEEGFNHLAAVMFHAAALLHFSKHEKYSDYDNRPA